MAYFILQLLLQIRQLTLLGEEEHRVDVVKRDLKTQRVQPLQDNLKRLVVHLQNISSTCILLTVAYLKSSFHRNTKT